MNYNKLHEDYKGVVDGVKYVLVNENGATVYMPLKLAKAKKLF